MIRHVSIGVADIPAFVIDPDGWRVEAMHGG
jgi:hypothetical protein